MTEPTKLQFVAITYILAATLIDSAGFQYLGLAFLVFGTIFVAATHWEGYHA